MLKCRLKHLKREDIDVKKWDDIIKNAVQSRIYAFSWYLDAMTDGKWSALVIDDYVSVFPILVKNIFLLSLLLLLLLQCPVTQSHFVRFAILRC